MVTSIGPQLGDQGSLAEPSAVAINHLGEIFISDKARNAIYKLSPEMESVAMAGGAGSSPEGLSRPLGMACDAALNLYVADNGNRRIALFDHNLHFIKAIDSYSDENNETGYFGSPTDIAIDNAGDMWIADDNRVLKLDPFARLLLEISEKTPGTAALGKVSGVDISLSGNVAIGDSGNRKVVIVSAFGNLMEDFEAGSISSMCWDKENEIWAADPSQGRVMAYGINGSIRFAFAESAAGSRPAWVTFDIKGRVVIADAGLRKITVYDVIRGGQ